MQKKRTYLIGGAGFLGRPLAQLLAASRDVVVVGRSAQKPIMLPSEVQYMCGDFGSHDVCEAILKNANEIIHLAYATVPQTSYSDPLFDLFGNLPSTVKLFDLASKSNKLQKMVIISSGGTIYGDHGVLRIKEDMQTNPISPYGITKLTIEKYAFFFHQTRGLPVSIVRPSNVYGTGQRHNTGQGFISAAIDAVLNHREISIFGYPGTIRDYLHISDAALGIKAVLDFGQAGESYNLSTGIGTSNQEIANILSAELTPLGYEVRINKLPARNYDVQSSVLEYSKLFEVSGWEPKVSLEDGVADACRQAIDMLKIYGDVQ